MKSLYVTHTPYHIILAIGTKIKNKNQPSDILIYKDFNLDNIDLEQLNNIFESIYIYDRNGESSQSNSRLEILHSIKKSIKKVKNMINNKYDRIFVFNDSVIETQYLINKNLNDKNSKVTYIEDGSNVYIKNEHEDYNSYLKNKLISFLLGFKYQDIKNIFGLHNKIEQRMVLWPNILKHELIKDRKPIKEISKEELKLGIDLCYSKIVQKLNKEEKAILIIAEHPDFFKSNNHIDIKNYIKTIDSIVNKARSNDIKIYIKYHPRDESNYLNKLLIKYKEIELMEKSIPIESFYSKEDIIIVSVSSTALFTAAKMINRKKAIISLANILKIKDKHLINKFIKIGVNVPNNNNELINLIGTN
ncbi:Uncharacterised protein [[Clostridium] sordellii]|uniref:polysialyltransferase family glycosyltransferase n=1 Tax=Paraclostridium sordellii TaxID=1505 RepID=UPI0005E4B5BE|nr:polysialyltransferase family glycosyltransferase [Paeniclostridium sordellii]CEN91454.1 Uncharacterised protein [[Clostridium] sordellii] [Paeniclostridium sordellii]